MKRRAAVMHSTVVTAVVVVLHTACGNLETYSYLQVKNASPGEC